MFSVSCSGVSTFTNYSHHSPPSLVLTKIILYQFLWQKKKMFFFSIFNHIYFSKQNSHLSLGFYYRYSSSCWPPEGDTTETLTFFSGLSMSLQLLFLICCSWSNFMVTSSMESCSRSQKPARSWEVGRGMALGSWETLERVRTLMRVKVQILNTALSTQLKYSIVYIRDRLIYIH